MFKSILLAVDSSRYSEVCTRYALEYAKLLRARVTVLSVLDRKEIAIIYPYYYPSADFPPLFDEAVFSQSDLFLRQKQRAEEIIARVEKACQEVDIPVSPEIHDGLVPDRILEISHSCELLFLGQRGSGAQYNTGLLGSNLENVVRRSDLPIIVTPHTYRTLQKILVCYDGSEYALRALRAVVHLAASCPQNRIQIRLLVVHDDLETARQTAESAVKYLAAYDIHDVLLVRSGDPAEQILVLAREEDVDLVAMGAYGHSRIREMVLGSITESILRQLNRALLLHH